MLEVTCSPLRPWPPCSGGRWGACCRPPLPPPSPPNPSPTPSLPSSLPSTALHLASLLHHTPLSKTERGISPRLPSQVHKWALGSHVASVASEPQLICWETNQPSGRFTTTTAASRKTGPWVKVAQATGWNQLQPLLLIHCNVPLEVVIITDIQISIQSLSSGLLTTLEGTH